LALPADNKVLLGGFRLTVLIDQLGMSPWLSDHVACAAGADLKPIPLVEIADVKDVLPGFQLWDCWPFEMADGSLVRFDGWTPWVVMCAPRALHPDLRHDVARLRLMLEKDGAWRDCGYLLPEAINPGSREWAGSTVYDPASGRVTLFFTAAGRRGDGGKSFEQRLFQTSGTLHLNGDLIDVSGWSEATESVAADGQTYMIVDQLSGQPGFIKGFRDPFYFRDCASERDYLFFTGSDPHASSAFNGVIGAAVGRGMSDWQLLPPVISAVGVNNELERPVMRYVNGLYYMFWSTQRKVFDPTSASGPTGLYGMVSHTLLSEYRPLNGSGLVAPNPESEPYQTYSWWVSADLEVSGFVDLWGLKGKNPVQDPSLVPQHFGGVPAPRFQLVLDGDRAHIA
jgi:levansucrase